MHHRNGLLGSGLHFFGRPLKAEALQQFEIAQHSLVVEGEPSLRGMSQRDVRQLARQRQREAPLVRQNINKAAADNDGVAYRKSFERRGHQHAAMRFDVELGRHDQIAGHGIENFLHRTGRRQQSALLKAREKILFRLALPQTLAFERRDVLTRVRILDRRSALDQNAGQFVNFL